MKAVILAAGYGSRMYPLAQDMPKCLLTVRGETILARQLRVLRDCGIDDVTVVTGFHQEKIVDLHGEHVSVLRNPHYDITNSIFSLWAARGLLTGDVIIMTSDIAFTHKPVEGLIGDVSQYCLVLDEKPCDSEAQKVRVENGSVVAVGKTIEGATGEFIGMAGVRAEGMEEFKDSLFQCVKSDAHAHWPVTFCGLARKGYRVSYILVDSPWVDIDTKEDLRMAVKLFGSEHR